MHALAKERDAALAKAEEAKMGNKNEMQSQLESLHSENRALRRSLKISRCNSAGSTGCRRGVSSRDGSLIAKHASELANINQALSLQKRSKAG